MSDVLAYVLSTFAGIGLGCVFYLGLWWTVRTLPKSDYPGVLVVSSFLLRSTFVLGGFFLLVTAHVLYLGASLVGFLLTRFVILRWKKPEDTSEAAGTTGGGAS